MIILIIFHILITSGDVSFSFFFFFFLCMYLLRFTDGRKKAKVFQFENRKDSDGWLYVQQEWIQDDFWGGWSW